MPRKCLATFIGKINFRQIVVYHQHRDWGLFHITHFHKLKKDDDLAKTIEVNKIGYAKPF